MKNLIQHKNARQSSQTKVLERSLARPEGVEPPTPSSEG